MIGNENDPLQRFRFHIGLSEKHDRAGSFPHKAARDIAWKAQVRLCARFRRLTARGINRNKIVVAIARELAGFVWAIARPIKPV